MTLDFFVSPCIRVRPGRGTTHEPDRGLARVASPLRSSAACRASRAAAHEDKHAGHATRSRVHTVHLVYEYASSTPNDKQTKHSPAAGLGCSHRPRAAPPCTGRRRAHSADRFSGSLTRMRPQTAARYSRIGCARTLTTEDMDGYNATRHRTNGQHANARHAQHHGTQDTFCIRAAATR